MLSLWGLMGHRFLMSSMWLGAPLPSLPFSSIVGEQEGGLAFGSGVWGSERYGQNSYWVPGRQRANLSWAGWPLERLSPGCSMGLVAWPLATRQPPAPGKLSPSAQSWGVRWGSWGAPLPGGHGGGDTGQVLKETRSHHHSIWA